jgi:hypothetical protein
MVYKIKTKYVYMTKERGCVNMVYKIKTEYVYMTKVQSIVYNIYLRCDMKEKNQVTQKGCSVCLM